MFGKKSKKQKRGFYDLLEAQAKVTMEGIAEFCKFCNEPTEELSKSIKNFEVDGDNARRLLISEINKELSALEKKVLSHFLAGSSHRETASALSISEKAVANALQRVRAKLRAAGEKPDAN